MDYFYCIKDKYNFIHSIDNCICSYFLKCNIDFAIKTLSLMGSYRDTYWERLNVSKCSKYSFYQNHIHYDDGIYIKIGHYDMWLDDKKVFKVLPIIQFEVNPNKHYKKDSFHEIIDFIKNHCSSGTLEKYDYAIDMNVEIDNIQLFDSRKERGLYKGTRYYGQRNKNGYCKIYDKGVENGLDSVCTRVEHTICKNSKLSLERIYFLDSSVSPDLSGLSSSARALCLAIYRLREHGLDYQDLIDDLPKATRFRLHESLNGGYCLYEYDLDILDKLLSEVCCFFNIDYVDSKGYMRISDDELPFD